MSWKVVMLSVHVPALRRLSIFCYQLWRRLFFFRRFSFQTNYDHNHRNNIGWSRIKMSLFPYLSRSKHVASSMNLVCSWENMLLFMQEWQKQSGTWIIQERNTITLGNPKLCFKTCRSITMTHDVYVRVFIVTVILATERPYAWSYRRYHIPYRRAQYWCK